MKDYLNARISFRRETLTNLHHKYAVTAATISAQREAATQKLGSFLKELGYA